MQQGRKAKTGQKERVNRRQSRNLRKEGQP